jgi:hypothetical protein
MYRKNTPGDSAPQAGPGLTRRAARMPGMARAGVAALASGTVAGALFLAAPAGAAVSQQAAAHAHQATAASTSYTFSTLDDQNDPTFNQLLGINSHNVIAGYFGSGADAAHPNKGYLINAPYGQASYTDENFPGSAQTQVTGLNNKGDTAGFWVDGHGTNHGFVEWNGVFESFNDPKTPHMAGSANQLLGINDAGVAVGFYTDANGNNHAYEVNQATGVFTAIKIPGEVSTVATGINNNGDIVGTGTDANKVTTSWLLHAGHLTTYQFQGGSDTQALGVNDHDEIVGSYLDASGTMHGFTLKNPLGQTSQWQSIDDTAGNAMPGTTVVNGINDAGDLVGFYTDTAGNVDGMLAEVNRQYLQLQPMPSGTVSFGTDASGDLTVTVAAFGFTPGSAHAVALLDGDGNTLAQFSVLTATGTGQADATLDSTFTGPIPTGSRLVIRNGSQPGPLQSLIIAETPDLDNGLPTSPLPLTALEFGPNGTGFGIPQGAASLTYNPTAQTLTVSVTATGVSTGEHAAHIHLGTCQAQGGVLYMLKDFLANHDGQIINQTRTVTGVTTGIPATGWYLNLHQGNSNNILKNGAPTIHFRPLLCANI